jgi:alpha-glucosidase
MTPANSAALDATKTDTSPAAALPWWKGAVIYQIYPRSFKDSNDDGLGDLKGCLEGLPHIASLGVDGIWLSPFYPSPQDDFGYDVSNYCDVEPDYGTLADFDRLLAAAHAHGLKVIIDLVCAHTSDQHAWFTESRTNRTNAKADWYVWADAKEDGGPPNNWQAVFGGPSWTWDARRQQYFMHNFLPSQPQLNVHKREVQDALLAAARFWLDRGVDGFRLDAINFAMHDPQMRDNPPNPRPPKVITRPFDMQQQKHNMSHPDIVLFLERMRALLNEYPGSFTVAEVGGPEPAAEMKAFTADDKRLNTAYNFDFLYAKKLSAALVKRSLSQWTDAPGEGWPSWAFSNHDAPRCVSRWAAPETRDAAARQALMLLLSLRGNAFIYQGEELGLPQAEVRFEDLRDPEAIANWPLTLGRDGARTPIPWTADLPYGGFSQKAKPWLPMDPRHPALSVAQQAHDSASMLAFTRATLAARRQLAPLRAGGFQPLDSDADVLAFIREDEGARVLCVFNLSDAPAQFTPPPGAWSLAYASAGGLTTLPTHLAPRLAYWARG